MHNRRVHIFDRISFAVLSCTVLLVLFSFIPNSAVPLSVVKGYLFIAGVSLSCIAWLIARITEGRIRVPYTNVLLGFGFFVAALFVSALFSKAPFLSFWGASFDSGSFIMLAALAIALFLASVLFRSEKRITGFVCALFFLYFGVALFQTLHVVFPRATAFGVFFSSTSTPVGTWIDLAYLSGGMLILATLCFAFSKISRTLKSLLLVVAVFATFFLLLINIFPALVLTALAEICLLAYKLVIARTAEEKHFPLVPFSLSLVLLFFVVTHGVFGGTLASAVHTPYISATPDMASTLYTARSSLHEQPILGAGPNRFAHEWFAYRPARITVSDLWDVPFSSGVSYLFTVGFLSGILGLLGITAFLALLFLLGFRRVFAASAPAAENNIVFSAFLLMAYAVIAILVASPGLSILSLAFISIGIFIAVLVQAHRVRERAVYFLGEYRTGFFAIFGIVCLTGFSFYCIVAGTRRVVAYENYENGIASISQNNFSSAEKSLAQATSISDIPDFEYARAALAERKLQSLAGDLKTTGAQSTDTDTEIEISMKEGESAALAALALDPSTVASNLALGDFYSSLIPLKVGGAIQNAKEAYIAALENAPNFPKTYIRLADVNLRAGDLAAAGSLIDQAIAKKPNYGEAYFEQGLMKYEEGDSPNAANSFRTAVQLDPSQINAWYYLGLAERDTGNASDARSIFAALHAYFPSDADITNALASLPETNL